MPDNIPEKFKAVREALGWRRNKFAEKLGIANSYISHIESGVREPGERIINLLYSELAVSREWFEEGKGEMFSDKGGELQKSLSIVEAGLINTFRQLDEVDQGATILLAETLLKRHIT